MSEPPLVLAVPSKGRLQDNAAAFFARAGLTLVQPRGSRNYRGSLNGVGGVDVLFLSAAEIVGQLASGGAHLGVTGEDLIREQVADADAAMALLAPLGFGQAHVVVAVPRAWIDVRSMADLDDVASDMRARHGTRLRVATKYVNLTRRFFAEHGVADYRVVESLGATEGAPASGAAEIVVDITTTGATLAANALKIIDDGTILRSEANLVASLRAPWGDGARRAARTILARIAAEEEARTKREVVADVAGLTDAGLAEVEERFGAAAHAVSGARVTLQCPADAVFGLVEALTAKGADHVRVRRLDYSFRRNNALLDALLARIGAGKGASADRPRDR